MARVLTLRERVKEIIRRYKHVNGQKFCYNSDAELKRRYKRITVWYLIHDKERGYSVMKLQFKRIMPMNVDTWARLHREAIGEYKSLYSILTQAILPAINNKGGNAWKFISLLAWAGASDNRPAKNTAASRGRNKTTKKRSPNARRRDRS